MCANGKGDFSMTIENALKWGELNKGRKGRAVEDRRRGRLSTPTGEWEETLQKLYQHAWKILV